MADEPNIWSKVDFALQNQAVGSPAADPDPDEVDANARRWRLLRRVLDAGGAVFWTYALLKVFVSDIDSELSHAISPHSNWVVEYRFFIFLAFLVLIVVALRKTGWIIFSLAYIALFPLVVVFWKLPRLLYRTKSWVAFFAVFNVVSAAIYDLRYTIVVVAVVLFSCLAILVGRDHGLLGFAAVVLVVLLAVTVARTIKFSIAPSRFLRVQRDAINKGLNSKVGRALTSVNDDLKRAEIEKFTPEQQNQFVTSLTLAVIAHRGLYFWCYQLEQYRKSAASVFFTAATYLSLLTRAVVALALVNDAIFKIQPAQFVAVVHPNLVTFIRYSLVGLYGGEIDALKAHGNVANLVSILTIIIGVVVITTLFLTLALSFRETRNDTGIAETISEIKSEGRDLEQRLRTEWEVSPEEAVARLEQLRAGLIGVVRFFANRMPPDFG